MISGLTIESYKALTGKYELEIKPLTILVGPNGSGKSSILEVLALISQSIPERGNPLTLDGELIKIPSYKDIFSRRTYTHPLRFEIAIGLDDWELGQYLSGITELGHSSLANRELPDNKLSYEYTLRFPEGFSETLYSVTQSVRSSTGIIVTASRKYDTSGNIIEEIESPLFNKKMRPLHSGTLESFLKSNAFYVGGNEAYVFNKKLIDLVISFFKDRLERRVKILSTCRGVIPFTIESTKDSNWVGLNGENLLFILSKITSKRENSRVAENIKKWAAKFGISELFSGWIGNSKLSSEYRDEFSDTNLNTALAGYGSRQALTMLTQFFWSVSKDIILVEEPEVSLHPEAQVLLPELFAEVIQENKSLIITTHSHFLILALSRPIND